MLQVTWEWTENGGKSVVSKSGPRKQSLVLGEQTVSENTYF